MLGGFYLLTMSLSVLRTRYGDAGLREILVQSEVAAEGSMNKVLGRKNYNHAVRAQIVYYESLSRFFYERFISWMEAQNITTVS